MKGGIGRVAWAAAACLLLAVPSSAGQTPAPAALADELMAIDDPSRRAERLAAMSPLAAVVDALIELGHRERAAGESARATAAYDAASMLARRLDEPGRLAAALTAAGSEARRRGDLAVAEGLLREAVRAASLPVFEAERARAVHQLGVALKLQGRFDEALACYREALAVSERLGRRDDQAAQLMSIGNVLKDRGDYARALDYYARALPFVGDDRDTRSAIYFNTAVVHEFQGDDALALDHYRRALAEDTANGYVIERAIDLAAVGGSLGRLGRFDEAFAAMDEALPLLERADAKIDVVNLLKDRADVLHRAGRVVEASDTYERARAMARAIDNGPGYADATLSLARLRLSAGEFDRAATLATEVLDAERAVGSALGVAEAATLLGLARQRSGRLSDAQRYFEEAVEATETQFGQVAGDEDARQRFFGDRLAAHHGLFEVHADAGRLDEAWRAAERGRARVLLDVLQRGRVLASTAMTTAERDEERQLRDRLAAARGDARDQAGRDLQAFMARIYAQHPALRLARGAAAIATRADAEEAIRDSAVALVSWVVTDTRTFAFVTTRDEGTARTTLHVVPVARGDLAARIEAFRQDVAARALTTAASGAALHATLLGPLQPRLSGRTRFVIAPDGPLWELPWAALQPSRGRYLLEDVAVTLVPSVTAWRTIATRPATGSPGPSVVALAQGRAVAGLGALPEARQQAADVRRLYAAWQVSVFDDPVVSEGTWRDHVAGHRIVHVAAHGVVDSTSPMSSALILGAAGTSSDGRLEARELLDVPLDADLVVLAACETARGRVSAGEGMIGLTWAALVAGARNVLVSQWKVDAASTTEVMRAFHARVAGDWAADATAAPAADEALRRAALALMRRAPTRHPFYWAGVVLIGDGTLTPASRAIAP